jgi:ABC-type Fe3+ transport system permease subunit
MNLFSSRKLSDEEFVRQTRKQLLKGKRYAWLLLGISSVLVVLLVWLLFILANFLTSWGQSTDHDKRLPNVWEWYRIGLATGVLFGSFVAITIAKVYLYIYEAITLIKGNRRDKLLIAFYDQLHPLDAKAPAPSTADKFTH